MRSKQVNSALTPGAIDKQDIESKYRDYVKSDQHPCIIAKSLFNDNSYSLYYYESMKQDSVAKTINEDIKDFISNYDFNSNTFESFIACFKNDHFETELNFEIALWDLLQRIHEHDSIDWDESVSSDIDDKNFSFSIQGKAFYIVGLHPNSSRISRRSPYVTVVFNLHWQFEKLREMGTFKRVRNRIRKNDKRIQGSINPVLEDFGQDSEVRQYSGRNVDDSWSCPFLNKMQHAED